MNWYKKSTSLDDIFKNFEYSKEIGKDPPKVTPMTLELYRGFDHLPPLQNGQYTFDPTRSEQGGLWFTHKYVVHYNPIEYASSHGKYLLTYKLNCKKHTQTIRYEDGHSYDIVPEEIQNQSNNLEDCKFYSGIELPEGWYFSYKMEKFIICKIPITVNQNQIKLSPDINTEE